MKNIFFFLFLFLFFCCKNESSNKTSAVSPNTHFTINEIKSPVGKGGEPNLFSTENGKVYMSWVEYIDSTTDVLMFSKLVDEAWSIPKEIARGNNWFVNWADFPSVVTYQNNEDYSS